MKNLWQSGRGRRHATGKGARAVRYGAVAAGIFALRATGLSGQSGGSKELPKAIRTMEKLRYSEATLVLRLTGVQSGEVFYDLNSEQRLLTAIVTGAVGMPLGGSLSGFRIVTVNEENLIPPGCASEEYRILSIR